MVFCWKLNPNNFCIVLSWPLSYLFTVLSWLPLWFPSVCWLCVYHWRLRFSQVLMSFIGHLVITCLNILVSLCSCQCIPCISASLSEISAQCIQTELKSRVSKKLQAEGGWCEGAHENVHKHKVNWAEPSWPTPPKMLYRLVWTLGQNRVLFWKQTLLRILHDSLENHEFPVSTWLLRTWFASLQADGQCDTHGNKITSCFQVSNYPSGEHLTIPWVIHWRQIRSKIDTNMWYSEKSSNTFSSCSAAFMQQKWPKRKF